jgi:hypothetical protein
MEFFNSHAIFRQLQIQGAHLATTKEKGQPRGQPLVVAYE